jgi:hypothetical protein
MLQVIVGDHVRIQFQNRAMLVRIQEQRGEIKRLTEKINSFEQRELFLQNNFDFLRRYWDQVSLFSSSIDASFCS